MNTRSILCPNDFSDAFRRAITHAVAIARWHSARIVVLHAHRPVSPAVTAFVIAGGGPADFEADAIVAERRQLARSIGSLCAERVELTTELWTGPAANTIVDYAVSNTVDLIVIGIHPSRAFEHSIFGSVSEQVLQKAQCPVLTVSPRAPAEPTLPFKRVLCPMVSSASSLASLHVAFSLAHEHGATLSILNMIDAAPESEWFVATSDDHSQHRRVREQHPLNRLQTLIPDSFRDLCSPKLRVTYGNLCERVLDVATEESADLIVLGVQARQALGVILFGSVTNQIVRRATCPVLTVPVTERQCLGASGHDRHNQRRRA